MMSKGAAHPHRGLHAYMYTQTNMHACLTAAVESWNAFRACPECNSCACIRKHYNRMLQPGRQAYTHHGHAAPVSFTAHATHTCSQSHAILLIQVALFLFLSTMKSLRTSTRCSKQIWLQRLAPHRGSLQDTQAKTLSISITVILYS